ncbi:MAG: UDP-3-O-(3-hydroxymyristoyl)glucosamine N-acyltransferase [Betaproteobacteria bacterium]|nr:UDP-3-O-(3-hydroxymyristoyl)glucosamine N-acyltransferase [Betaproteobacteria bacterium]
MKLGDLVKQFGGEAVGEVTTPIEGVGTLDSATAGQITFLANPKYRSALASTRAAAVIVGPADRDATDRPRIVAANPYAYFARVAQQFQPVVVAEPGIHPSAIVGTGAQVATSAEVGAFVTIGRGAVIGEGARIGAGCVIGDDTEIGEHTVLQPRVTLLARCRIGRRGIIHSGAVIGADGFGFAPDFKGEAGGWVKVPQTGRVLIGDDCEIGANTTIDRGAIDDTVIGNDVKIDNLVQIGHNCTVGDHSAIAGCVGIAGSSKIGKRVMIGGKAGVIGHLEIGDDVIVSAMTLVTKSIAGPGTYTSGTPLLPHAEWLKNATHFRRLDEMAAGIKDKGTKS